MKADLTLELAKKTIRQSEAVREHTQQLNATEHKSVEEVRNPRPRQRSRNAHGQHARHVHRDARDKRGGPKGQSNHNCTRCGQTKHKPGDQCPAKQATYRKCNRKGHYAACCFSKTVAASAHEVEAQETAFLGTLTSNGDTSWTSTLRIAGKRIQFKLDTGAEVTAISESTYQKLSKIPLQKPSRSLQGPAGQSLTVLGQFTRRISHAKRSSNEVIFVVRGLKNNLLGFPAIKNLCLINKIDSTTTTTATIRERFASVFEGLGTLGEEYEIQLKDNAVPYSLCTPRNVPLPLRDKVREELQRMESLGVISKVDTHTPWCAGMVVVRKKSGDVRICVDLKPLNESVLREVHPIPSVDETLGKLAGATVFSKLDANSGFWQIPLSQNSRLLTTFITPFGRFCFNKLPFGISSAPELFQKRMNKVLEGLEGVVCHMDDVLVVGKDQAQHDERLTKVFERIESAELTLNAAKCELSKTSVKFLATALARKVSEQTPTKQPQYAGWNPLAQ